VVAPKGDKNIQILKQGKDKMRATVILLIGYDDQGMRKAAKPFIIFKA
jgi:hypothetical protein